MATKKSTEEVARDIATHILWKQLKSRKRFSVNSLTRFAMKVVEYDRKYQKEAGE